MASLFNPFEVRVDPWQVDYGSETPLASLGEEPEEHVDPTVEVSPADWKPIEPPPAAVPACLYFVDGVRRLEARLQVNRTGRYLHGAFGSHAVGCVRVAGGKAEFADRQTDRLVVFGSNEALGREVPVRDRLVYHPRTIDGNEPDAPLRLIQNSMRKAEGDLACRLLEKEDAWVVSDGPLTFEERGQSLAIGFIKRITQLYLPDELLPVVTGLPAGCRTPLFAIERKLARYAWYVRLASVHPAESQFHGLARLEVHMGVGKDLARTIADTLTHVLPRFAPTRARDPRSPQNLLPISALEQRLRHELGDPRLLRRWIEELIAREVTHA